MSDTTTRQPEPGRYEIRAKGHLDPRWAAWFDGLSLTRDADGTTVIQGPVLDQAALYGVLLTLRDLGLPLSRSPRPKPGRPMCPLPIPDSSPTPEGAPTWQTSSAPHDRTESPWTR